MMNLNEQLCVYHLLGVLILIVVFMCARHLYRPRGMVYTQGGEGGIREGAIFVPEVMQRRGRLSRRRFAGEGQNWPWSANHVPILSFSLALTRIIAPLYPNGFIVPDRVGVVS